MGRGSLCDNMLVGEKKPEWDGECLCLYTIYSQKYVNTFKY